MNLKKYSFCAKLTSILENIKLFLICFLTVLTMKSNEGTVTSLKDSVTDLQGTHKSALIQGCNARKVNRIAEFVFTLPPRDSTLQYKRCVHL